MIKSFLHIIWSAFFNSYGQLFFADHKLFAWLLLLSSYINPITGVSGSIATVIAILFSKWIGLDEHQLKHGSLSYNALMTGLVLGSQYNLTLPFIMVLTCAALISVLFTVVFNQFLFKYRIPALSIGFLITLWSITLAIRGFNQIENSENGLFRLNEWYSMGGLPMVDWLNHLEHETIPEFISVYLKSLSAVFFQYNIFSGFIIAIGIVIWSRIGFVLSLLGFVIGYGFYYIVSGEFTQLYYSYIGFNFILTAIALGGFYLIPSRASFLIVIIAMPIIGVLISALSAWVEVWQLPIYSLPFVLTVMMILLLISNRIFYKRLIPVTNQLFSPEKNLYYYLNQHQRFKNTTINYLQLPFYGEWVVSQGYNGAITHKEEWQHALDFVVTDETKHTYKLPGTNITDYYCYGLPVLSPNAGYIVEVIDGIEDNVIGNVNIKQNWGNTIVIKHTEGLYSKIAHLKKDSITVRLNDYVSKGMIIGYCGSSGRSPEPHLHFQVQTTPFIGSKTFSYPIALYIRRTDDNYILQEFNVPSEGDVIHHPIVTPLLFNSLNFIPGKQLKFSYTDSSGAIMLLLWECETDSYNQTLIRCAETNATAYFVNNGNLFYFTNFVGNQQSKLYYFYLALHKILLGYYQNLTVNDHLPITTFNRNVGLFLHDFIAPFYQMYSVKYNSKFTFLDNPLFPEKIEVTSCIEHYFLKKKTHTISFQISFQQNQLQSITVVEGQKIIGTFTCIE